MDHLEKYFKLVGQLAEDMPLFHINEMIDVLAACDGRVFVIGLGGSAGNASHMVNDLRKLCHIEAYSPLDNVSEFSAVVNDDGIDGFFVSWLINSNFNENDILFVLSVGGGNREKNVSVCISQAVLHAYSIHAKILGIVGRDDGTTAQYGDHVLAIPQVDEKLITPLSEAFQAVVWHAMVSDPRLQACPTKW